MSARAERAEPRAIALLGGTGAQGRGLALRFALAGYSVVLGSRDPERARGSADELNGQLAEIAQHEADRRTSILGATNANAAAAADTVIIAVPYAGHAALIASLRNHLARKTVISCVNPISFDSLGPLGIRPEAGSAAEEAAVAAPEARMVAAFHHLSAPKLRNPDADLSGEDVLLCGDDEQSLAQVEELTRVGLGATPLRAGALRLAGTLEAMTAVIISVNKRYRVNAGLALTGLARGQA